MAVAGPSIQPTRISDLPIDLQRGIVQHVDRTTALQLQLVSRHFHQLASARIYYSLRFRLAANKLSYALYPRLGRWGRFADALHTLSTSDHDYCQYVKYFSIELLEGERALGQEELANRYRYQDDPSKLLNTLLVLFVRRATILEGFGWDVPIELSTAVYKALGQLKTLKGVCLSFGALLLAKSPQPPQPPPPLAGAPPPPPPGTWTATIPAPQPIQSITSPTKGLAPVFSKGPTRKISCFTNLQVLEIRGLDDLDCVAEIAACIRSSTPMLRSLSLSFSQQLVKACKKIEESAPANVQAQSFDDGDDAMSDDYVTSNHTDNGPITSAKEVKSIRTDMASFLAKVLSIEPANPLDSKVDKALKRAAANKTTWTERDFDILESLKKTFSPNNTSKQPSGKIPHPNSQRAFALVALAIDHLIDTKRNDQARSKPKTTGTKKAKKPSKNTKVAKHFAQPPLPIVGSNIFGMPPPPSGSNNPPTNWDDSLYPSNKAQGSKSKWQSAFPIPGQFAGSSSAPTAGDQVILSSFPTLHSLPPPLPSSGSGQQDLPTINLEDFAGEIWAAPDFFQTLPAAGSSNPGLQGSSKKPQPPNIGGAITSSDSDSNSEQSGNESPAKQSSTDTSKQYKEDDLDFDVDMEHPDVISGDDDGDANSLLDDDEQHVPIGNPTELSGDVGQDVTEHDESLNANETLSEVKKDKGKSKEIFDVQDVFTSKFGSADAVATPAAAVEDPKDRLPEDIIRQYLVKNHGLSIENFALYLIPLKPSVMGRALDLSCLRSITLLSVGPQGAFWTLMSRQMREGLQFQLRTIHTDDVSQAFLSFVADLPAIQNLFLLKRATKEFDSSTSKIPATVEEIRTQVLRKHAEHLLRFSIVSYDSATNWNIDKKTVRLLAGAATKLRELACSTDSEAFHYTLRLLPRFKALILLNLIKFPSSQAVPREVKNSVLDIVDLMPGVTLKVLAVAGSYYRFKPRQRPASKDRSDRQQPAPKEPQNDKGKGKAVNDHGPRDEEQTLSDIENEMDRTQVSYPRIGELEKEFLVLKPQVRTGRF